MIFFTNRYTDFLFPKIRIPMTRYIYIPLFGKKMWRNRKTKTRSGGQEYRITLDCRDFQPGREYIQVLIKKKREFRVLFCLGKTISLLRKRCSNLCTPEGPWNHAQGSFFVSIRNEENFYPGTEFLVQLSEGSIIKNSDLCGVDIIQDYDDRTWILEVNSAPAISIQDNLNKATEIILNHPRFTD